MAKKILVVITNHDTYPAKKKKTGLWLSELTHFYELFEKQGIEMDFVSPRGGTVPLDKTSIRTMVMDASTKVYYNNPAFMKRLEKTMSPDAVNWEDYVAVYYTGGHGTMWDFPDSDKLQEISRKIYESGGVISAVCHGISGLLNIRLPEGQYLINDKQVTGFSDLEENMTLTKDQLPFVLEDEIKKRGAHYKKGGIPFTSYAVRDGRLVTGQNPQSARAVAIEVDNLLKSM